MLLTILIVLLLLGAVGALPHYPYSAGWGYYPSGAISILVIILVIILLFGRV